MDQKQIGQFIAALRHEKGLTQKELAAKLAVSDKTVSKWECGRGLPELSLLQSLCAELGVGINELLAAKCLDELAYREKAEQHMTELLRRQRHTKQAIYLGVSVGLFLLPFVVIVLAAGKVLPAADMPLAGFFSTLLLAIHAAGWTVYGVTQRWHPVFLVTALALHAAMLMVLLWLLGIIAMGFLMI